MRDSVYRVIDKPLITEKTNRLREEQNQYVFQVAEQANKIEIRRAVEAIFNVRVRKVRTMKMRGDRRRFRQGWGKKPDWKKAIVTLHDEDTIDVFEGV